MSTKIEQLKNGLVRTFETMGVAIKEVSDPVKTHQEPIFADVSAHLALIGSDTFTLVMVASEAASTYLVKAIAGTEVSFEDALIGDTLGELLNVVAGSAQKEGGYQFSIPVVARGRQHEVKVLKAGTGRKVTARLEAGEVSLILVNGALEEDRSVQG